jgi:RNA polymerase sigma-70 factor (ECF subfamily)
MRTDAELATAFRDGDDRAFALLYERHKAGLYVFASRMLGDPEAARDLVQDVFLGLYEKRRQLARPESFRSWLFASGRNRCLSRLRERRECSPLEEADEELPDVESRPDLDVEAAEEMRLLRASLGKLRPEYREVLILREYEDLSYREIAFITNATESAVKSTLFKARRALHEAFRSAMAGGR